MGRVRAAFISLLVCREKGLTPSTAEESSGDEGTVRLGEAYCNSEQSLEKLKGQWIQFMSESFRAIATEEMRLRREELKRRIGSYNQETNARE